ncbi:glutaredoxin [Globomyces pollinis-pini]|nr:glutaredoxin [Globomyces pollinis-pini]
MSVKEFVDQAIKNETVVVFSKTYCPYCIKAKNLLKNNNIDFTVYELDNREDGQEIQDYLATISGQRTVPNIYVKGTHVGGCDAVHAAHANGTLAKLLK